MYTHADFKSNRKEQKKGRNQKVSHTDSQHQSREAKEGWIEGAYCLDRRAHFFSLFMLFMFFYLYFIVIQYGYNSVGYLFSSFLLFYTNVSK